MPSDRQFKRRFVAVCINLISLQRQNSKKKVLKKASEGQKAQNNKQYRN
jgi:hypothetical protein